MRKEASKIGWFAGLFDGDGTIRFGIDNKNRLYTQMVVELNDEETVNTADTILTQAVGYKVSRFSRVCRSGFSKNPKYGLRVQARHPLVKVLEALLPYVILKRRKMEAVSEVLKRTLTVDQKTRDPLLTFRPSDQDRKLIELFHGRRDFDPVTDVDSKDELGWLAGMIDAEGSFILTEKNILFAINMTSRYAMSKVAAYIEKFCGFSCKVYDKNVVSSVSKQPQFYIHVRRTQLQMLLDAIIPHLVTKQLQARIMKEFLFGHLERPLAVRLSKELKQHRREARLESLKILERVILCQAESPRPQQASRKAQRLEGEPVAGDNPSMSAQ